MVIPSIGHQKLVKQNCGNKYIYPGQEQWNSLLKCDWWWVGYIDEQSEHSGYTIMFHRAKFIGVGRVSHLACKRKDSCFSGKPYIGLRHKGHCRSKKYTVISKNLNSECLNLGFPKVHMAGAHCDKLLHLILDAEALAVDKASKTVSDMPCQKRPSQFNNQRLSECSVTKINDNLVDSLRGHTTNSYGFTCKFRDLCLLSISYCISSYKIHHLHLEILT